MLAEFRGARRSRLQTRRFSDSLMARIFACHARDPSSILGLRDFFAALSLLFFNSLVS